MSAIPETIPSKCRLCKDVVTDPNGSFVYPCKGAGFRPTDSQDPTVPCSIRLSEAKHVDVKPQFQRI